MTEAEQVLADQGLKIGSYFRYNSRVPADPCTGFVGIITGLPWLYRAASELVPEALWLAPVRLLGVHFMDDEAVLYCLEPISEEDAALDVLATLGAPEPESEPGFMVGPVIGNTIGLDRIDLT
jgi:hypothetical protein